MSKPARPSDLRKIVYANHLRNRADLIPRRGTILACRLLFYRDMSGYDSTQPAPGVPHPWGRIIHESRRTGFQPVSGEDRQDACPTSRGGRFRIVRIG